MAPILRTDSGITTSTLFSPPAGPMNRSQSMFESRFWAASSLGRNLLACFQGECFKFKKPARQSLFIFQVLQVCVAALVQWP